MKNNRFPLATSSWDDAEYKAIARVIGSGQFTMGDEVKQFEEEFAKFFKSNFAVMVNSGSSANLLMTSALFYTSNNSLRLKPGDDVIVPAVSWSTTYFPLHQYGLKLKFVDIDLKTLNYNLYDLRHAISETTRAIMVVNLLGNPNDFSEIKKLIGKRDIVILEDNCESMGAIYEGQYTGTMGIVGSFSTYFSHHISTMEGGVVVTDDEELYHIMLSLRAHGWTRQLPVDNTIYRGEHAGTFDESYNFILPGYNLRPLELSGAIGIEQLKKVPSIIDGRRKNAELFVSNFKDHPIFQIQEEIETSSWFGFSLIVRPETDITREQVLDVFTMHGFECRPIVAGNFLKNPVVDLLNIESQSSMKNADLVHENGLFIGNHHYSMTEALNTLCEISQKI